MTALQTNYSHTSNLKLIELEKYEMDQIEGGNPLPSWLGPYAVIAGAAYVTYEIGHAIGGGIYYMTH